LIVALFREAPWLTPKRLRDYSTLFIAAYVVAALWALMGQGINDPLGRPIGTDFLSFWTVSSALHHGEASAIYHPDQLAALERMADPASDLFYAWLYPPIALLIVYPLAFLPYLWSLLAWLSIGLGAYLTALWRLLPRRLTLWSGLAFPAVFVAMSHGQNALLTAGLLGWALSLLPRRPALAGVPIGLLTFKPQLGLVIPFALAAGGFWPTLALAAVTAASLAAATVVLFGSAVWCDFLTGLTFTRDVLEYERVPYDKLQSVFAAVGLLGGAPLFAYILQGLAACAAIWLTSWAWRQPVGQDLKNALLVTAGLLATPFVLDYDLTLLAIPMTLLAAAEVREGAPPWQRTLLAALCLAPILSRIIAHLTHLLVAPIIELTLLLLLVARIRTDASRACEGASLNFVAHP
jgi:alpha-1,2-mannosyltransferase